MKKKRSTFVLTALNHKRAFYMPISGQEGQILAKESEGVWSDCDSTGHDGAREHIRRHSPQPQRGFLVPVSRKVSGRLPILQ